MQFTEVWRALYQFISVIKIQKLDLLGSSKKLVFYFSDCICQSVNRKKSKKATNIFLYTECTISLDYLQALPPNKHIILEKPIFCKHINMSYSILQNDSIGLNFLISPENSN